MALLIYICDNYASDPEEVMNRRPTAAVTVAVATYSYAHRLVEYFKH